MPRDARPFPWSALPRVPRAALAAGRAALRHLAPAPTPPADLLGPGWRALLGTQARAAPGLPVLGDDGFTPRAPSFTAVFEGDDGAVRLAVIDRALARPLAARALALDAPEALPLDAPISAAEEGALIALCAKAATLACAPAPPPRLRAVTDDTDDALAALRAAPHGRGPLIRWPWAVSAPPWAGTVTLLLTAPARPALPFPPRASVLNARVTVRVIAGRARWPASEVASLRAGELLALDGLRDARASLTGGVDLALGSPDGPRFSGTLTPLGARVDSPAALPGAPTMDDTTDPRTAPMQRAVLDAIPVEVTVEIARATATVAELSMWRPGEVIPLPAPVGGPVTVFAGGRAVARGELVDVEGMVGVRVTEAL